MNTYVGWAKLSYVGGGIRGRNRLMLRLSAAVWWLIIEQGRGNIVDSSSRSFIAYSHISQAATARYFKFQAQ